MALELRLARTELVLPLESMDGGGSLGTSGADKTVALGEITRALREALSSKR